MSLRACCSLGSFFSSNDIADAILFAVNNDADIINASFGGPTNAPEIQSALQYANDNGVLVIAAAGNYATNNDTTPLYPANYDLPNIVSVGSTNQQNNLAYFSNYGQSVDITAPGVQVQTLGLNGTSQTLDGTSFSTPFVTSVAGRYLSQNPQLSAEEIKQRIFTSAYNNPNLASNIHE